MSWLLIDEPGVVPDAGTQRRWHRSSASAVAPDLGALTIVEVSQELVEAAGRFADGFALRGYVSVQLAAAHQLQAKTDQPLTFACFD